MLFLGVLILIQKIGKFTNKNGLSGSAIFKTKKVYCFLLYQIVKVDNFEYKACEIKHGSVLC